MKFNQQSIQPAAETGGVEANRPIWFLGRELKGAPAEEASETPPPRSAKAREAAPLRQPAESPPEERRPSPLEAYMRYAKMREPHEDDSLAPVGRRRFPAGGYAVANE